MQLPPATHLVACFQYQSDANAFGRELAGRMQEFGLELKPEKTRLLLFGRFARERAAAFGKKPGTFEFLGFTTCAAWTAEASSPWCVFWRIKGAGNFWIAPMNGSRGTCTGNAGLSRPILRRCYRGSINIFALHHCERKLDWVLREVQLQWIRTLRRRSQRHRVFWSYLKSRSWFELPYPKTLHPTV